MAALPQFDYLFAIGTIFSFLDAWNIGMLSSPSLGNDVLVFFHVFTLSLLLGNAHLITCYRCQ